jgi:hypothetical protein
MALLLASFAAGWVVSLVQNSYPLKSKVRVQAQSLKALEQEVRSLRLLRQQEQLKQFEKERFLDQNQWKMWGQG